MGARSYSINKLENFRRTDGEQRTENRQRIQNLRPLLSPWIVGVSGPILGEQRTENREQTDREFNYRGHSYPLRIIGVSRPIPSLKNA